MDFIGVPYEFNRPWPFWFYVGKIVSKAFFDNEQQLEWFNTSRVGTREFIGFANTHHPDTKKLNVVEVDFAKPQPGQELSVFWKPARGIISQKVQLCA